MIRRKGESGEAVRIVESGGCGDTSTESEL